MAKVSPKEIQKSINLGRQVDERMKLMRSVITSGKEEWRNALGAIVTHNYTAGDKAALKGQINAALTTFKANVAALTPLT